MALRHPRLVACAAPKSPPQKCAATSLGGGWRGRDHKGTANFEQPFLALCGLMSVSILSALVFKAKPHA